ncbi:retrotransposon gag protein [Cucumis melo var. makuwa]|uniref:Retrotransposon gag protein n=1 Tax=Cucumis melo var. makuwa TaxID=1194695 RepID=A0A5A7UWA5_CUCMM|nr:retrotransposon gag protein [Cucumis melo var. makuwa]
MQEQEQGLVLKKKSLEQLIESPKGRIIIRDNPLFNNSTPASNLSDKKSHLEVVSVMMVDVTAEATMAEIEKKINFLMKVVEEQDHEIAALKDQMKACETAESSQTPIVKATDKGKNVVQDNQPQQQSVSVASLLVWQLQDTIANSIRAQYGGPSQTSFMYSKPYTKRIHNLRMPLGYQPQKFQQFDGKGNPKQHIAHFVETCKNAGSRGDQLVRQFVRSLKGNAFEWYTDLEPEVIDSWEQLEIEFLNRFYNTRRVVSMMELTNTKQRKGEPVIDYINQWRALSLDCKDKLTELSAVEMCTQGMHWELLYILQGIKPRTFEELATRTHDMELSIANRGAKDFLVQRTRSDKNEINDIKKIANNVLNESMLVQETPLKSFSKRKETKHKRNHDGDEKRHPTLRERQKKVYPFPDSDVADMLEQLIEKQLIQFPECKRPKQTGKVDDPNYCKYYRVISHPVEKCFVLKELILKLARENKIELNIDEVAQTNHVAVNMTSSVSPSILLYDQRESLIQFGTFEPILIRFQQKTMTSNSQNKEEPSEDEGEEWIGVAHKKERQTSSVQTNSHFHQKHSKGNISHKKKGRRNKKMWKPKPIKGKDEDFLQPRRSITLAEFFPRSFLEDHSKEILEVTACHTTSIVEFDNNYDSYEEVDNSK